jgi:hypothetical protein
MKKYNLNDFKNTRDIEYLVQQNYPLRRLIQDKIDRYKKDNELTLRSKASDFVQVQWHIQDLQTATRRTDFWFITVNPKPSVKLHQLRQSITKFLKVHSHFLYCYEITDNPKKAPHCHILLYWKNNSRNSKYQTIQKFINDKIIDNPKAIDIKWLKSPEDVKNTIAYILKTKTPKSKQASDKLTKAWRIKNNIKPHYIRGDNLFISLPAGE